MLHMGVSVPVSSGRLCDAIHRPFHTSMWYGALHTVASVHLVRKEVRVAPAPAAAGSSDANPAKRRRVAADKRDTTDELFWAYNTTGCKTPCKHGRMHVYAICGKGHPSKKCPVRVA